MAFEELSENLKEQLLVTKSRFEESKFVNAFNEKFSSLSKQMQNILIVFAWLFLFMLILIYPIKQYTSSLAHEADFEKRKELTQELISYSKNKASQNPDPKKYGLFDFKNEISTIGKNVRLLDSQFSVMPGSSKKSLFLPKGAQEMKFKVTGNEFNLTQVITTAYGIKNLSESILLQDISIMKSRSDKPGNYFDVDFQVANFYVKSESELLPKAAPKKTKRKKKTKTR